MKEKVILPAQIESLISNLQNPRNSDQIKSNYRNTLDLIRAEIERVITEYDKEFFKR